MKPIKNPFLLILVRTITSFGINPLKLINSFRGIPGYVSDTFKIYQLRKDNPDFRKIIISPCLGDKYEEGGDMSSLYFQQDLYVAQLFFQRSAGAHLDIGSRTDGFVAHVATFRQLDVVDIRDIKSNVHNINFRQSDMMRPAPDLYNQYDSISSLHAIEHFGLGRYGDPINLNGHLAAFDNIFHILRQNGILYFSTPIGPQRIEFNAHRVFSLRYLIDVVFKDRFKIVSFSFLDDDKILHKDQPLEDMKIAQNYGCNYGCGIFVLEKLT